MLIFNNFFFKNYLKKKKIFLKNFKVISINMFKFIYLHKGYIFVYRYFYKLLMFRYLGELVSDRKVLNKATPKGLKKHK